MNDLRRWQLDSSSPFVLQIAADARLTTTDYTDDQSWELSLGTGDSSTLALQTRYGGRAGLVSLVPLWTLNERIIYQAQDYERSPYVTAFAPGYLRAQATLKPQLALQAEYWVIDSHAVGVRFTIANARVEPTTIRLDLFAHTALEGHEQRPALLPLPEGDAALALGKVGDLYPLVLLAGGQPVPPETVLSSPKIGQEWRIAGRKKVVIEWVHAARPALPESLTLAQACLKKDWSAAFTAVEKASAVLPVIETGDEDRDAAIAFSYQQLMQAFLRPTAALPHASFVAIRDPGRGFSTRSDSHTRDWSGQPPQLAYLVALAAASADPALAQGIVLNYLAVQQPDGWIDGRPGLGGQRVGYLCAPLLARLAWGIFQYSEDEGFLRTVFPGLLKFFERWFAPDLDADGDGLPEWQTEAQTGYVYMPTFAAWQAWGQKTDIRTVETPDLVAHLLSEAKSLREIAFYLRRSEDETRLNDRIAALQAALESLWREDRYSYRDRDTHLTAPRLTLAADARGGEELLLAELLNPPNRLVVEVTGGVNLTPRMTLRLDGLAADGRALSENAAGSDFLWAGGRGVYTSRSVFAQIDRVVLDGLSRVYRVAVHTPDTTRSDINALLPLWSVGIPPERAAALVAQATDPARFWRASGIAMCPADDPDYDPSNASGAGGIWPFWLTLIGEGLIEYGYTEKAAELVKRLLAVQTAALKSEKCFFEFYHADQPKGLGERGHVGGLVPLHLLLRVLGVRIISPRRVWAGGPFVWDHPVTVRQHGVTVSRSVASTRVVFPSGHTVEIANDTFQQITDPSRPDRRDRVY